MRHLISLTLRLLAVSVVVGLFAIGLGGPSIAGPCGDPIRVTLDIGHSPARPGAISARGKTEYAFNRRLTRELADALRKKSGFEVHIINEAAADISLAQRSKAVEALDRGLFLSIHHDSVQPIYLETWTFDGKSHRFSKRAKGYSLFVSGSAESFAASEKLARAIGNTLLGDGFVPSQHHAEPIEGENRPAIDPGIGLFRYDGLAVLKRARVPAVLIEAGVILHPSEELSLETAAYRSGLISLLIAGIEAYCK